MAVVHFVRMVPAADGVLVPAKGGFRFTPTARRVIVGAPDVVVLPASFSVQLVGGAADVTLEPTTGAWVWRVDEYCTGTPARTTHVAVPDVAELDDTDLVVVDPATLEPAAEPEAAWVAMAQSTITTGTVTGDDLILTRTDGTTVNAGVVRGADGTIGVDGASAYEVAVANGFVGTETEWLASLQGADGTNGTATGIDTATLTGTMTLPVQAGYTYELLATAAATVTLTGPNGAQVALVVTTGGNNVVIEGKALGGGTYVAHKVTAGWNIHPVGSATIIVPPGVASPSISGVTTTTATATWAAVATATGYNVRVNGGTSTDVGNVLTYQATGLPSSTAGTIEVQAYNAAGTSAWASAGFTTATPAPVVIRLTKNDATATETGDATAGWNYAFAATPYNKGAYSTLSLAAGVDGFVEYTIAGTAAGTVQPIVSFNTAAGTAGNPNAINGVQIQTSDLKYVSTQNNAAWISTTTAANGDRVRFGRTGLTYWTRYSRDGGATWTDLRSWTAASAVRVYVQINGNAYTGQVNNVRAFNFS